MTTIMTHITRVAPIMVTRITRVAVTLIPRCAPTDQSAGHWARNVIQGWKENSNLGIFACYIQPNFTFNYTFVTEVITKRRFTRYKQATLPDELQERVQTRI